MFTILLLPVTVGILLFGLKKLFEYRNTVNSIQNLPGYRTLLSERAIIANLLPEIAGITPGGNHLFRNKYQMFRLFGCDIHSVVSIWPTCSSTLFLADAAAVKEVSSSRSRFPKPVQHYSVLSFFGRNIVSSEGEEWKKYRKIAAPAFSDRNNEMVWNETIKIMNSLFEDVWGAKELITVDHCLEMTLPIALFVIGVAGFGREMSWKDEDAIPEGHQLTFKDALHTVSTTIFLRIMIPDIVPSFTKKLRDVRLAFKELELHMNDMVQDRQISMVQEKHDLFSSLLNANDMDTGDSKLTVSELIGNVFIFLLAGHETTANTLCFSFALLALYPEEQEILYQHIKTVLSDGRIPIHEDMPRLTYSMAVFYETLRMFPPVVGIPKESAEDTVLTAANEDGRKTAIPVPKGADIVIHVPGLHYNPRYWNDPESFKPSRFLGDWPRDAFLPFSAGARACLGRRFFETEGIAILTMLVSRYKIKVKEEPQFAGESFADRKARMLKCRPGLTLTPVRVPLIFELRGPNSG